MDTSKNLLDDRMIHGDVYADKVESIEKELLVIQEKYIDFFKKRPPENGNGEHDLLENHYDRILDGSNVFFIIDPESDLPAEIKKSCNLVFSKHSHTP